RAFWARVKQGLTIIFDRRRYFRQVWGIQAIAWLFRFTAFWFMLEAFNIGASPRNVMLVLGVNAISAALPFTPGGAGAQQALLVQVFGNSTNAATSAACCSALPWRLRRLIEATVMSTASLIALSAQATRCAPCICSASSAIRRRSSSGSPNSPPKGSSSEATARL